MKDLNQNFRGVEIPQSVVESSDASKAKREKTLAQLPVFRTASNLLFVVAGVMKCGPNSIRKFFDEILTDVAEMMKAIGMADASRNPEDRSWYIDSAIVLAYVVRQELIVLLKLEVIGKDTHNKMKALVRSVVAQLVGWRGYTRSEGAYLSNNPADNVAEG